MNRSNFEKSTKGEEGGGDCIVFYLIPEAQEGSEKSRVW
jgi:hypothetical protein